MKILVFVPTYNESGNILKLIDALLALEPTLEVLIVDDHSPDGTNRIVAEKARNDPRVHLIDREPPRGRGLAGRDGFAWFQKNERFDVLVEMDGDFSHHPRFIPALVDRLRSCDVCIGSRFVKGGGETGRTLSRKITSLLANTYLRFILHARIRDCTSGFRSFSREALAGIDFTAYESVGPTIVSETLFDLLQRNRKIMETPILFENRFWGESKLSIKILAQSLLFPLKLRLKKILGLR